MDPLVSCIMPTWNRRAFVPAAIDCWLKQTYENRELIILDDGDDRIKDLIPANSKIVYIELPSRISTGAKRNRCCEAARGKIICHFDDDDWSSPGRIADQVARLRESRLPITGYGTLLFWDILTGQAKRYISTVPGYVCGTSLCYLRSWWQKHPFPNKQEASDNGFVYPALKRIESSHDSSHMVARIHDHHTSSKSGITEVVPREMIPSGFWENEKLRAG
jgi:glycosyltransferase involved in cell wall biosynthesis